MPGFVGVLVLVAEPRLPAPFVEPAGGEPDSVRNGASAPD
jgi:hypothetical protein